MIKNFDVIKEQLKELAGVINSFKSEAVQLRLIELVFEVAEGGSDEDPGEGPPLKESRPRRQAQKKTVKSSASPPGDVAGGHPSVTHSDGSYRSTRIRKGVFQTDASFTAKGGKGNDPAQTKFVLPFIFSLLL